MIKEAKNIDFYTSGRELSDQDFARISAWIKTKKQEEKTAVKTSKPIKQAAKAQ